MAAVQKVGRDELSSDDTKGAPIKRTPGTWDYDVEWLLRCSSAALGIRGTTASVIAAIERGGVGGGEDPNWAMLRRFGWAEDVGKKPRDRVISRERELSIRYAKLDGESHTRFVFHYLVTTRVDRKIHARAGILSGMVVYVWLRTGAADRSAGRADKLSTLEQDLNEIRLQLAPVEDEIRCCRSRLDEVGRLRRQKHDLPPGDLQHADFMARARISELEHLARPLRSKSQELLGKQSQASQMGSAQVDMAALVAACERGEVPELKTEAEAAIKAAHAAWYETAGVIAEDWVES